MPHQELARRLLKVFLYYSSSLMQLITPVLQFVKIPPDPVKSKALFGLNEKPKTAKLMLDFMLDMLLMPYK